MFKAKIGATIRTGGIQDPAEFQLSGMTLTHAWGAQPATATCTYVRETVASESIRSKGILTGAAMTIIGPGHTFDGVCVSDVANDSSGGKERVLTFHDLREFLKWDYVFCALNMVETLMVAPSPGAAPRRVRRYWHILPVNFASQIRTYTVAPLSAAECCNLLFGAGTVMSPWSAQYHPDMGLYPHLNFDALSGKRLDTALTEIGERLGLVFTCDGIVGSTWRLRWGRMGQLLSGDSFLEIDGTDGSLVWPINADDCRDGLGLTDAPNRVRVLGDRNVWQLLDVEVEPDWVSAWEVFFDPSTFIEHVFANCSDQNGQPYRTMTFPNDPDQVIARQLAMARAYDITVAEFAGLFGSQYLDTRRFAGRLRADMPCVLYIGMILFHCYRLPAVIQVGPIQVPATSLNPIESMLCQVTHDPVTGLMTASLTEQAEGNGYGIAQGYNLGGDIFEKLNPNQFDLASWITNQELWQHVTFQLDDAGDGTRNIVLDQPMVKSQNLLMEVNGHPVPNRAGTIDVARVRVALTVEADKFIYDAWEGNPNYANRVTVINENGLHEEYIFKVGSPVSATNPVRTTYADGLTAEQKAWQFARCVLGMPWYARGGGYQRRLRDGDVGTTINGWIDRVTLQCSDRGVDETVDFTLTRGKNFFEPERDYERRQALYALFPGQKEAKHTARLARQVAAALRSTPAYLEATYKAYHGFAGGRWLTLARVRP